jgi:dihydropteroate synthase
MFTLNCKGKIISLRSPVVMGILNITPDSFHEGHISKSTADIIRMAGLMISEGATIIDIGGQSTRPGSKRISAAEETDRVIPVIEKLKEHFNDTVFSIDTYHSSVAKAAVASGASLVNDISGGFMDENMIETVAALGVPYVCMHMKGTPETMQQDPVYEDVTKEVLDFFIQRTAFCTESGIRDIIIDPGFGFGKSIRHNFQLLHDLHAFSMLQMPIMAGLSRKSTVYKSLGSTAAEALNGTTVLHTISLLNGASILRVHDVKEAMEAITLVEAYKKAANQ